MTTLTYKMTFWEIKTPKNTYTPIKFTDFPSAANQISPTHKVSLLLVVPFNGPPTS